MTFLFACSENVVWLADTVGGKLWTERPSKYLTSLIPGTQSVDPDLAIRSSLSPDFTFSRTPTLLIRNSSRHTRAAVRRAASFNLRLLFCPHNKLQILLTSYVTSLWNLWSISLLRGKLNWLEVALLLLMKRSPFYFTVMYPMGIDLIVNSGCHEQ